MSTDTSFKAGSLGSIKDLLQRANEAKRGRIQRDVSNAERETDGNKKTQEKEYKVGKVDNVVQCDSDEKETAAESQPKSGTKPKAAVPSSSPPHSSKNTQPHDARQPPKCDAETNTKRTKAKKLQEQKPKSKGFSQDTIPKTGKRKRYAEIKSHISSFDQNTESGTRHYVFLPSGPLETLCIAYGERRLSAILSALIREHIATYKEEIIHDITERSILFTEPGN